MSSSFSRWLFFIEGTVTILVAFWSMFILPDFPENSSNWLTPAEQALALQRMVEDAGHQNPTSVDIDAGPAAESDVLKSYIGQWPGLYLAVTDGKVWWLALTLTCMVISLSFHAYFPTLSATLGYDRTVTLLLCAPPWLFAVAVALPLSRSALLYFFEDSANHRCAYITDTDTRTKWETYASISPFHYSLGYWDSFLQCQP